HADGIDDVLQDAAQLAIAFIVHRLQVDLVAIGPGPDVVQHFGRGVAVRDERGLQTGGPGRLEYIDRPFGGDQRLDVRRAHHTRTLTTDESDTHVGTDV